VVFIAGQRLDASDLNQAVQKIVGRGSRPTNATAVSSTTEQAVLRVDSMSVKSGYLYQIFAKCWITVTNAADVPRTFLHLNNAGAATTSSTQIDCTQTKPGLAADVSMIAQGEYVPAADETISVLLSYNRAAGAGTVTMLGGTNNPIPPIRLYIICMGPDVGDTGVDL
jgi:hypothetical protein